MELLVACDEAVRTQDSACRRLAGSSELARQPRVRPDHGRAEGAGDAAGLGVAAVTGASH